MIRFSSWRTAACAATCALTLAACGSSSPLATSTTPTPAPGGPLEPVMRCAPDPDGAFVASADCSAPSTERRS